MEKRRYKYEFVADEIRRQIAIGRLVPGARLQSAKDLGESIGCHPHTVRQAFKVLEREGILENSSGNGTFVTSLVS